MCKELFERVGGVVKEALRSSQVTLNEISEVVLMGGGTRIPRIQEVLKHHVQRQELGKGINTDEAAALGAVYQAAHLGMGFKVQKFSVKDCVLFPVQVRVSTFVSVFLCVWIVCISKNFIISTGVIFNSASYFVTLHV